MRCKSCCEQLQLLEAVQLDSLSAWHFDALSSLRRAGVKGDLWRQESVSQSFLLLQEDPQRDGAHESYQLRCALRSC